MAISSRGLPAAASPTRCRPTLTEEADRQGQKQGSPPSPAAQSSHELIKRCARVVLTCWRWPWHTTALRENPGPAGDERGKRRLNGPNHRLSPPPPSAATARWTMTAALSAHIALFPHAPPLMTQPKAKSPRHDPEPLARARASLGSQSWRPRQEESRARGSRSECDLVLNSWEQSCLQTQGPQPMSHRALFEILAGFSVHCYMVVPPCPRSFHNPHVSSLKHFQFFLLRLATLSKRGSAVSCIQMC